MTRPTWGNTVKVKQTAPPVLRPGQYASVCGIREIENREQELKFCSPVGTTLYLIEFGDGISFEIREDLIELVEDDNLSSE